MMRQRGFVSSEMRGCPFLSYGRCPRGFGPENAEPVVGVDAAGASSPTGGRETAPDSRRFLTVWPPDPRLPCRVAPRCGGTAREAPGGRAVRGRRHAWGPLGLRGHDGGGGHFGAEPVAEAAAPRPPFLWRESGEQRLLSLGDQAPPRPPPASGLASAACAAARARPGRLRSRERRAAGRAPSLSPRPRWPPRPLVRPRSPPPGRVRVPRPGVP